jgi:hypothetical protein
VLQVLVLAAAGTIAMMGAPVSAALDTNDVSALNQLRSALGGASPAGTAPTSWTGTPTCADTAGTTGWFGVKCDASSTQRVIEIDLSIAGSGGTAWTTAAGTVSFGSSPGSGLNQLQKLVLKDNVGITALPSDLSFLSALALLDVRSGLPHWRRWGIPAVKEPCQDCPCSDLHALPPSTMSSVNGRSQAQA